MGQLHYSSDWWEHQYYHDALAKVVKVRRLLWMLTWGTFVSWMPYFIGNRWRMFVLRLFGLKESGGNVFHPSANVWAPWNVEFGSSVAIDDNVNLYSVAPITIGTKVAISRNVFLCTASHDISRPNIPLITKPIVISDGVWVCANAIILPGVTIGEGAIVAAGSVVTKDVPCWAVVAGNPARVVKMRELTDVNGSGVEDCQ